MNWNNTKRYSGHLTYLSSPIDKVFQVLLMLPKSLTLKAIFCISTWPCYTREEIYTQYVHMLTHRLKSMSEHKLHSDIKVWVAISEFPIATVSYGPTLAQVLACWKKSTVSASMQTYAENKYALKENSVFSLLAGGVPYLLTSTQPPSPALAEKAAHQLREHWKKRYIFLLFCSAQ